MKINCTKDEKEYICKKLCGHPTEGCNWGNPDGWAGCITAGHKMIEWEVKSEHR